jgi:hypothetical protein
MERFQLVFQLNGGSLDMKNTKHNEKSTKPERPLTLIERMTNQISTDASHIAIMNIEILKRDEVIESFKKQLLESRTIIANLSKQLEEHNKT